MHGGARGPAASGRELFEQHVDLIERVIASVGRRRAMSAGRSGRLRVVGAGEAARGRLRDPRQVPRREPAQDLPGDGRRQPVPGLPDLQVGQVPAVGQGEALRPDRRAAGDALPPGRLLVRRGGGDPAPQPRRERVRGGACRARGVAALDGRRADVWAKRCSSSSATPAGWSSGSATGSGPRWRSARRRVSPARSAELEPESRLILKMHFEDRLTVAAIARTLGLDQKPLYRRIDRCLGSLRDESRRRRVHRPRRGRAARMGGSWPCAWSMGSVRRKIDSRRPSQG